MKLTILLAIIFLASCTKQADTLNRSIQDPSLTSVTFSPAYAGSSMSVKFTATFSIPSPIKAIKLFRGTLMVDDEKNPENKTYVFYDHMMDTYPTYAQSIYYYFEFVKEDGTKTVTEPFQVY